jgi:hypothetical protein
MGARRATRRRVAVALVLPIVTLLAGCGGDAPAGGEPLPIPSIVVPVSALDPPAAAASGDASATSTVPASRPTTTAPSTTSTTPSTTTIASSTAPNVPVPTADGATTPPITEAEIAELERQLDEIDALLAGVEHDLDED